MQSKHIIHISTYFTQDNLRSHCPVDILYHTDFFTRCAGVVSPVDEEKFTFPIFGKFSYPGPVTKINALFFICSYDLFLRNLVRVFCVIFSGGTSEEKLEILSEGIPGTISSTFFKDLFSFNSLLNNIQH